MEALEDSESVRILFLVHSPRLLLHSHTVEEARELSQAPFLRALIPFMT